jgi:hypothetical protein
MAQVFIVLFSDTRFCFVDVLLQVSIKRRGSPHTTAGSTSLHSDTLIVLIVLIVLYVCLHSISCLPDTLIEFVSVFEAQPIRVYQSGCWRNHTNHGNPFVVSRTILARQQR